MLEFKHVLGSNKIQLTVRIIYISRL